MNTSPAFIALAKAIGLLIITGVLGYLGVASNDLAFGTWGPIVSAIAVFADGLIEQYTGRKAFGAIG